MIVRGTDGIGGQKGFLQNAIENTFSRVNKVDRRRRRLACKKSSQVLEILAGEKTCRCNVCNYAADLSVMQCDVRE